MNIILAPALRCKAAVDRLMAKAIVHHSWSINNDLLHPPQHQLTSRMPLWSDMELVDIISQWHNVRSCPGVVSLKNGSLMTAIKILLYTVYTVMLTDDDDDDDEL